MSIWNITKSLFLIFMAVVIWVKADAWIDKFFNNSKNGLTVPQVVEISENVMQIHNTTNQHRFDDLEERLRVSDSIALQAAQEYAEATNSQITALGQTVVELKTSFEESKPQEVYTDEEKPTRTFEHFELTRKVGDKDLPVGWVKYHPDWEGEDPLVQYFYPLEYYNTIVKTEDDEGNFSYTSEVYVENNFVSKSRGIKYPLELKSIEFEEKPINEKKFRFNPRVGLGGGITTEAFFPNLNVSMFSYGRTKVDMDWRFISLGLGVADDDDHGSKLVGVFTPAEYNIGKPLPIVDNVFVGPAISFDTDSEIGLGLTFSVPF